MTHLALIDVSHIFRSNWAIFERDNTADPFAMTIKAVLNIRGANRVDKCVVAYDKKPYDRCTVYPDYKGNREAPTVEMTECFRSVKRKIKALGVRSYEVVGCEADDIIATLCLHSEAQGWTTEIFTADKDLCALVSEHTTITSTRVKGEKLDVDAVLKKFQVYPRQVEGLLALMGDSSDNIPGCPGVGKVNAAKLMRRYGTLKAVLAAEDIEGKVGALVKEHKDQIILSAELVRLRTDCPIVWGDVHEDLPVEEEVMEEAPMEEGPPSDFEEEAPPTKPSVRPEAQDTTPPSVPTVVDVKPPSSDPRQAVAPPVVEKAVWPPTGPGLVKAPANQVVPAKRAVPTSVELRPGVTMTSAQMAMTIQMAKYFHDSGLYRRKFESQAAIWTVMELGTELGLSPQVALQLFHVVEGRPCPSAQYLISAAEADPNCEWMECISHNEDQATYATKKVKGSGQKLEFTFTMADAETAGLLKNHNWRSHPKAMLRKQAGSMAARLWYPRACAGLYSVEEMGHMPDENAA